jgi:hypothetical protein
MIMNRPCLPTILSASPTGLESDGAPALAAPKPDSNEDVERNFERLRVSQLEPLQ